MTLAVLTALGGGLLIGSAAVFLKAATGHILGVSGILGHASSCSAGAGGGRFSLVWLVQRLSCAVWVFWYQQVSASWDGNVCWLRGC